MRPRALPIALAALLVAGDAAAGPVEGRVFVDANGDGTLSRGEETLSGVQVAWETEVFATSGDDGLYELETPNEDGIVWARVPDGYRPGPVWGKVGAAGGTVDLPLVEIEASAPAHFVVASDLHIGKEKLNDPGESLDDDDLERSLRQAAALVDAPRFFALTGDLVQSNQPQHYAILRDVAAGLGVPVVPVPGNHDWFDGGASYRETMGPPMYSFDSAGAHYIVLNDNASVSEWSSFLQQDTGDLDEAVPLVGFIHRPPEPAELAALESSGIDYLFTGHWHSNMTHQFGD
ncbi:MAG TPA: metallophosphoesterase, partial [Kofleriaceae bacterium]|nr:metallophosphoesterase [Kofleriaceae bacterium]